MPGIYRIVNTITGHSYIGSTNDFKTRKNRHFYLLSKNKHFNYKLQQAYNTYGKNALRFETIVICSQELLFKKEQIFLDLLEPEYNISKNAEVPTSRGGRLPEVHKDKIRQSVKGYRHSQEAKEKMSEAKAKIHSGLVSPEGLVYRNIKNMAKFCREHGLQRTHISDLEKGNYRQHKGWRVI